MALLNTNRPKAVERGFKIIRLNTHTGQAEIFLRNKQPRAAAYHPGSGGIERRISCKFSPDGRSLYVVAFSVANMNENLMVVYGHTGVLWPITRAR